MRRDVLAAVNAFLTTLSEEQRAQAVLPFEDEEERRTWYYWPTRRQGIPMRDLDAEQQRLAWRVVAAALSIEALAQATTIAGLETVLDDLEEYSRSQARDPVWYFTTVFGTPGEGPWGWRFEGHHVSLHLTFGGRDVAVTPNFLGSNPARIGQIRPLALEEDLGYAVLAGLSPGQWGRACLDDDAPDDILTRNVPVVGDDVREEGVPARDLDGTARDALEALVDLYVSRVPGTPGPDVDDLFFAWAGSPEPGPRHRHYYRIQGPRFLVELDNTQNDSNHVHTVWRDPANDFGDDLLRAHRAAHHSG
jgi:hypothetical protein